jgi:predicted permease
MWSRARRVSRLLRNVIRPEVADAELDEELSFHLEMEAARHVAAGVAPEEARRRALHAFGGIERHREAALMERSARGIGDVLRDFRHAGRSLRRAPVHSAVTVLTLALGIGAATALFSVVDGVLLRPLAYPDADRLFTLYESREAGGIRNPSYPSFEDWRERTTAFAGLAWVRGDEFRVRGDEGTQRLLAGYVSADFFGMAGTPPLLGRTFGDPAVGENVVVLSYHLWRQRFGGDAGVLGSVVSTTDGSHTVIGVMPQGFRLPAYADVWLPLASLPADGRHVLHRRDLNVDVEAWGRTRDGVTPAQAQQDLARVVADLAAEHPDIAGDWTSATLTPVRDRTIGDVGGQFRVLTAAVALLLLIVCVNVAGLQLARGTARVRELAVRSALGAGRGRLVRQLLAESLLLALVGAALGVVLAGVAVHAVGDLSESVLPRVGEIGLDLRTLGFALAVSVVAAIGFGMLPALRASAPGLTPALRSGGGSGEATGSARLRSGLVIAQVALGVTLTVGSGLLLRSLQALLEVDPGYDAAGVVTLRVFPPAQYDDPDAARQLYGALQEAVRSVPGVTDVALANHAPLAGGWMVTRLVTGEAPPPGPGGENVIVRTVSAEYFDVMRSRLRAGRFLDGSDLAGRSTGVVVNDVAARRFFGGADPLGRTVTLFHAAQGRPDFGEPIQATVVGVVQGERFFGPEVDVPPAVFVPFTWMMWQNITLLARTELPPASVVPALRRAVQQVEVDIPVAGPSPQAQWRAYEEFAGNALKQRRLVAGLVTGFAASALGLAVLGIFGVTAWFVARRAREIGIRVALGAVPSAVAGLVLRRALLLSLLGVAIGLPAALAATRVLQSQLYGVTLGDPVTLAGTAVVFMTAAVTAAAVPLWRALRIPPTDALRAD